MTIYNYIGIYNQTDLNLIDIPQICISGMIYTDDEICEFKQGPGYRFRYYPAALVSLWGTSASCCSIYYPLHFNDFFSKKAVEKHWLPR